jgi:hypothetical protein
VHAPLLTLRLHRRTLQRQVENLRRTRDLLLPRLLSGQIDVEVADDLAFAFRE